MDLQIEKLLTSDEPCLRYKVRVGVLGEDPESRHIKTLRREIARSPRVQMLLSDRDSEGRIPGSPYQKWTGAHWVLTLLADIGYPEGDRSLRPMIDQGVEWALRQEPRVIDGRPRRCASQEGNALLYAIRLGFADERCDALADRLIEIQWDDGGWNCDKKAEACHSSFHESLIPLRGLNAYARATGSDRAAGVVGRAAEHFLQRSLFKRETTGEVIRPRFARTHYPYFWQYSFLHGLKAMSDCGKIGDPRCVPALEHLESKRTADGGFPAESKYYSVVGSDEKRNRSGRTRIGWGPTSAVGKTSNEFVTAEALAVFRAAEGHS